MRSILGIRGELEMVDAVGPVFTGGFEEFVVNGESGEQYTILYLPDRNNDQLQREGKAPVYYWVPGQVRLARFGDTGDFKFRHIHFVGVMDEHLSQRINLGRFSWRCKPDCRKAMSKQSSTTCA
ncbi:hypothetical protein [Methanosarcina mazei]|nr:hypothetical protein [Methanosarcina mazei]